MSKMQVRIMLEEVRDGNPADATYVTVVPVDLGHDFTKQLANATLEARNRMLESMSSDFRHYVNGGQG